MKKYAVMLEGKGVLMEVEGHRFAKVGFFAKW